MFEIPKFITNSFSVVFKRVPTIRRMANDFEDHLKGHYFQPQILPVPDDFEPAMPRIIFGSEHGYSQIIFSQISCSLNVTYSTDWQTNISKGKNYLLDKAHLIFDLLEIAKISSPYFNGLTTQVHINSPYDDNDIITHLARTFLTEKKAKHLHDLEIKKTQIIDDKYFHNTVIENYRKWPVNSPDKETFALSRDKAIEWGIGVTCDYNDRYSFNEGENYQTNLNTAITVINAGINEAQEIVEEIRKGGNHE